MQRPEENPRNNCNYSFILNCCAALAVTTATAAVVIFVPELIGLGVILGLILLAALFLPRPAYASTPVVTAPRHVSTWNAGYFTDSWFSPRHCHGHGSRDYNKVTSHPSQQRQNYEASNHNHNHNHNR